MAPIKRRPRARSHPKMKSGRRKPRISQLVYEYLNLGKGKEGVAGRSALASPGRCRFCNRPKALREEALDSGGSRAADRMANKRKDSSRSSKVHHAKRRPAPRDQSPSSCMHKVSKGEGVRKMKMYIQKAIDFGVESGYLIPKDAAYRVLRVSSDLMRDANYKVRKQDARSPRRTPIRFEDYEVQDAMRRRRSRRRSRRSRRRRSGSRRRRRSRRRRGRRRSGSADEEVVEVDNEEYEPEKGEKRKNVENVKRDDGDEQMNQSDGEKAADKRDDDGTEMSMDEDESEDDEDDKKREDTTKS